MNLEEFTENDFDQLIKWISSDKLNYLWGGPDYSFPLTQEQIANHCNKEDVTPFMFKDDDQNIGFIEFVHLSDDHCHVGKIFISDEYRGQGLAKTMLEAAFVKAKNEFGYKSINLAVFDRNTVAKSCYKSLGFKTVSTETGTRSLNGEDWDLVRMKKIL